MTSVLETEFELDRDGLFDLLLYRAVVRRSIGSGARASTEAMIARAETEAANSPLTQGERYVLWLFHASLVAGPVLGTPPAEVTRLSSLINDGAVF